MGGWVLILGSWGGGTDNAVPDVPGCEYRVGSHRAHYDAQERAHYQADGLRPHCAADGRAHYETLGDRPHYATEEQ